MTFEPVPFYFTDQGVGSLHDGAGLPVNNECRRGHYCWRGALLRQWLVGGGGYINIDCAGTLQVSYIPGMCHYSECD